jgi:NADH:ubiquinone oxidoreductase subunit H
MTSYLIPLMLAAVSVVLVLGLINMARGGPSNKSQMFMRWRVGLQFVAIIVLMLAVWFTQK